MSDANLVAVARRANPAIPTAWTVTRLSIEEDPGQPARVRITGHDDGGRAADAILTLADYRAAVAADATSARSLLALPDAIAEAEDLLGEAETQLARTEAALDVASDRHAKAAAYRDECARRLEEVRR